MNDRRWIGIVVILMIACPALGRWGEDGHRIVGWIAYQRLAPEAKSEIDRLLAMEATTLPEAAYWPDAVARRQPEYRFANQLHYANVPKGSMSYDPTRDRPAGGDVVSAIERYADALTDKARPDAERLEALRFLSHFVGDIHQPLHVGFAEDRGGNDISVLFYNRRVKLHAVWDSGILERARNDWEPFAEELNGLIRPEDVEAYTEAMDPLAWAQESYALAISEVYADVQPDETLGAGYVDAKLPVVEDQLSIAGVRLAALMNAMFAGQVDPSPDPESEAPVYVTRNGRKYHAAGCRYLQGAHESLGLDEARGRYDPCRVCDPPE